MTTRRAFLAAAFGAITARALPNPEGRFLMQKVWLDGQLHTLVNGQLVASVQIAECPWVIVPTYESQPISAQP